MSDTIEITHDCPRSDESVTLCCGRSPFELRGSHRLTLDHTLVTCPGGRVPVVGGEDKQHG
jgi:hypothetical protein